jgi:hypothetical protein
VGLKQPNEAISACTQVLAQDGGMIDAYFQLAEAHLLLEDYDKVNKTNKRKEKKRLKGNRINYNYDNQ